MSDETNDLPVHQPGPAPAPTPADVPAPDPNAVAPSPAQPPAELANAPTPNVQQPSLWRRVLAGALHGLGQDGIPGAVRGAIAPKREMDIKNAEDRQLQDQVRFADLRSATAAAQLAQIDQAIHEEPEKMQQARDEHSQKLVSFMRGLGVDFDVVPNTTGGGPVMDYMKQATAMSPNGMSVPAGVNISPSFVAIPKSTNSPESQFNVLSKLAPAFGLPVPDKALFLRMTPQAQARQLAPIMNMIAGHRSDGSPLKADELQARLTELKARRDSYANRVRSGTPGAEQSVLDQLDDTIDLLGKQGKSYDAQADKKTANSIKVAQARGAAMNDTRYGDFLDENNNIVHTTNHDAWTRGLTNANTVATKALSSTTQLAEMRQSSGKMREAVKRLDAPFTGAQMSQIRAALTSPEGGVKGQALNVLRAKLGNQKLTTGQQDFLVWMSNLDENAMALRSLQGIGQSGSDQVRQAIIDTLPTEGDTPQLMNKKLDAFDNKLAIALRGVPGVGRDGRNTKTVLHGSAAPQQGGGSAFSVTDPNGKVHPFDTQEQADNFRKLIGVKK